MIVYAIGDLHLPGGDDKPMAVFGAHWEGHWEKICQDWRARVTTQDVVLVPGDISWAMQLEHALDDLHAIAALPGRKILLRGNHDMFWDAKRTASLNRRFAGKLSFLQNIFFAYEDYALVGTKGFTFEGPFYLDGQGRVKIGRASCRERV